MIAEADNEEEDSNFPKYLEEEEHNIDEGLFIWQSLLNKYLGLVDFDASHAIENLEQGIQQNDASFKFGRDLKMILAAYSYYLS